MGVSMDFTDSSKKVLRQHAVGNGRWCLDCACTWRMAHIGTLSSLAVFGKVFLAETNNRVVWNLHIVAYVSLMNEDRPNVRMVYLPNRAEL